VTDALTIEKDRVVRVHYDIRDPAGELVESSRDEAPFAVLHGHGALLPALENALVGHRAGDRVDLTLEPGDAFGERRADWTQRVSKKYFPNAARLKPGMQAQLQTEQGPRTVTVVKVGGKVIDVDLNHPLAGRTLRFELEVVDVREATPEEISHGHAHGPDGHHH
jgi:FKBP-type peptidyl-prolyl cis-trans isomerase SlyD